MELWSSREMETRQVCLIRGIRTESNPRTLTFLTKKKKKKNRTRNRTLFYRQNQIPRIWNVFQSFISGNQTLLAEKTHILNIFSCGSDPRLKIFFTDGTEPPYPEPNFKFV